jgi:hypothetical protein
MYLQKTKAAVSQVSGVAQSTSAPVLKIDHGDLQDIQVLRDKLYRVYQIIESNLSVCSLLEEKLKGFGAYNTEESASVHISDTLPYESFVMELKTQASRVKSVLNRGQASSDLVRIFLCWGVDFSDLIEKIRDIMSFRALEALNISSGNSVEMARLAQNGNENMLKLTQKSLREARTLKTITILTMIYLPASFASVRTLAFISRERITIITNCIPE